MKLRNKVLISIGCVWLIFLGVSYIQSKFMLIKSFLSLEHDRADGDLSRVDQALDQVSQALYSFTSDWSHWNDLYSYMQGKNPSFVPNNLNMTAYVNSHINLMTFWNKQGQLVLGTSVDTDKQKLVGYPTGLEVFLKPGSPLLDYQDPNKQIRTYAMTSNGLMMLAAGSITDGDKALPPLGVMINGRYLDPALVQKISDTTKIPLELFLPSQIDQSSDLKSAFSAANAEKTGHFSRPIDQKFLHGYSIIKDFSGKPVGMFRMTTPRSIYLSGVSAVNEYLITFAVLGVLFSLFMLWLLRILIIRRLEKLDDDVAYIGNNNAIKRRVDATGNDEISAVSIEINHVLDIIQASHDQLELRVEQRTQELQKSNTQLSQEITERKSVERELIIHKEHLVRLAHYDNLTSLPNRVFFNEILNKALSHAKRHNKVLSVLFIDLDKFKNINDAFGHTIGDLVLKEMGTRFNALLRAGDILARLGGDEYIVLLNDIGSPKYAGPVAEKIIAACAKPVVVESHEFFLTASIGISIYPNDGVSLEDLQKNADMAMYKSKRAGGGTYQYYTEEMDVAAHEHIKLEAAMRKAIQNEEFVLFFQPQMHLANGKVTRAEALIRWESPELGMVSPANFIPLAEETGLIMPIGEWVVHTACRINKAWQDEGYDPITVAVNISPKQFRHQDIAKIVADALAETGLDPKYLEVEITETAVMDDVNEAISKLTSIRDMGVQISVDDFGTGYTSINYLRQFPVSIIKIDQTFIKGIPNDPNDLAITSAVIALGHSLGLEVIAEGVETAEQLKFLTEHGCDLIQGYFLSRPLPASKVVLQFTKSGKVQDSIVEKI